MTSGINFKISNFSETINQSYSYDIKKDVEDTYEADITQKLSFDCDRDPLDPDGGVGLWQWVVESSDGKT